MRRAGLEELDLLWDELHAHAERLARDGQWFAGFFRHAAEACLLTDPHAIIRSANPAAAALLKRAPGYLPGKPLAVFVPLAERAEFRRNVRQLAARAQWTCSAFRADVRRAPGGLCWTLR